MADLDKSASLGTPSEAERIVIGSERVRNRRRLSSKIYKSSSPSPSPSPSKNSPSPPPTAREERSAGDGSSRSDEEAEEEELARLRCTSERTEVIAEREQRRRRRVCSDYPGISFGTSIFSSDTLMKFSVIKNELHNVLNSQLKRVSHVKPSLEPLSPVIWATADAALPNPPLSPLQHLRMT